MVFGIDKMVAAVGLILITAVYTIFGGLTAVILTDVAQVPTDHRLSASVSLKRLGLGRSRS